MGPFILRPGKLSLADIQSLLQGPILLQLDESAPEAIYAAEKLVIDSITDHRPHYGINTGFGPLANTRIDIDQLLKLQKNIVLSHSAGTGAWLPDAVVRLILLLKINSLARGFSGVRLQVIEAFIRLFNMRICPCVPAQGSVGASGDLAPLAHLSAVLLGQGHVHYEGTIMSAADGLRKAGLSPLTLAPKEGLALLNGTQVSTALALYSLFITEKIFIAALITGALTTDATLGSHQPFDERIQRLREHAGQIMTASLLRQLLIDSTLHQAHADCDKVQDPYSIRCQPQVMGACLANMQFVCDTLVNEANAVSDNPLLFPAEKEILSGGNFHAEPIAMASDTLALCIAEIGALAERRIALLMDPSFSQLPPFLVNHAGVNSGFMMAQVTAAALASENKSIAHPACVDSIPTSINQEDHVSMATFAARRLMSMTDNSATIIGIELLAACQGIDFRRPLQTSVVLETVHRYVRQQVAFYAEDRYFADDIATAKKIVLADDLKTLVNVSTILS